MADKPDDRRPEEALAALSLFDVFTRQAVYVEGLKAYQIAAFDKVAHALEDDLRSRLLSLRFDSLDGMTKAEMNVFVAALKQSQMARLSAYARSLLDFLERFMAVDLEIARKGIAAADPDADPPKVDAKTQWSKASNAIIPAAGLLLPKMITAGLAAVTVSLIAKVWTAYADKTPVAELLILISGTPAKGRAGDTGSTGAATKARNQMAAVIATVIQHVHNQAVHAAQAAAYEEYLWVSVLDSRTTAICRERDGNRYRYGEGPIPPAHYNCRSTVVPIGSDGKPPAQTGSFADWVKSQPQDVRAELNKNTTSGVSGEFKGAKPLDLEQYKTKGGNITQ